VARAVPPAWIRIRFCEEIEQGDGRHFLAIVKKSAGGRLRTRGSALPLAAGSHLRGVSTHLDILLEGAYPSPRMSTRKKEDRVELLQGTLDLLILRTLLPGRAHGHAIAKAIERHSEDVLQVEQGSLYPALHRLIKRGWISAEEGASENNRRAKYYRLTPKGRRQLTVEATKWERLARAITCILRPAGREGDL
jgi:PadR family transcriptional regulator PadR